MTVLDFVELCREAVGLLRQNGEADRSFRSEQVAFV